MSNQSELTLEKLAEADKCTGCNGAGNIRDAHRASGIVYCPKCEGQGRNPLGKDYSEVVTFLAREIIKTNERLDWTEDALSRSGMDMI